MKLGYTILYVSNVAATVDFYERAFGLQRRFVHEGGDYAEMDTGSTALAFSSRELMRSLGKQPLAARAEAPSFEIALVTDNVEKAMAQAVAAGAKAIKATAQMPWGQTIAYVADIDGFLVELCTPVG